MSPARTRRRTVAALVAAVALVGIAGAARHHLLPEHAPAERGAGAARALGCWSCHQAAERTAGPAAPSIFAGSRDPAAIRAAILDAAAHAATWRDGPPSPRELADLAAWIAVVQLEADRAGHPAAARTPVGAAERLARRNCFGCHGDLGQGGTANPGSLKGYVPGFFGRDFDALTRGGDPAVVREWIRDGAPEAFHSGLSLLRLGAWLTARQQVQMPAYARTLRPEEVEALVAYLALLRSLGPLEAEDVARYRTLRRLAPEEARAAPALPRARSSDAATRNPSG
ncbi:MAG TPA: c-type cytochrome [Myxococcota bacterium]|nr:c-type cytochrome [Myxococcota bacterium]